LKREGKSICLFKGGIPVELTVQTLLKEISLRETIQNIHCAITEKFPTDEIPFDAWYTNRDKFWENMDRLSRSTAQRLREVLQIPWQKDVPEPILSLLEAQGTTPKNWEDGPDGALAALAIVATAWVAHQAAQKSRDNPNNFARKFFEEVLRPILLAAMEEGIRMGEEEEK
jgi:hypothetical protein